MTMIAQMHPAIGYVETDYPGEGLPPGWDEQHIVPVRPSPYHVWQDGAWVDAGIPADVLKAYAADARYRAETGGLTINGQTIATDRESQTLITGAYNLALQDPNLTINWKTGAGFVQIDAPTMIAIATAVAQHVQSCFTKEAEVVADIEGGTITTYAQVDAAFATL